MRNAASTIGLMFLAALCIAQQARNGNQEFYEYLDFSVKLLGKGRVKILVVGDPMKATFVAHSLRVSALRFEGVIVRPSDQKSASVETATISGNVKLVAIRPSSQRGSKAEQTLTISTATAHMNGAENKITCPNAIVVERADVAASETGTFRAGEGSMILFAPGSSSRRSGIKNMSLTAGVNGSLTGLTKEEGKVVLDSKGKPISTQVSFSSTKLTYDDAEGKLELSGNAKVWGNHPLLFGDLSGNQIVLMLNQSGEIEEIVVRGTPGTANVVKKPPPATHRSR